MSQSSQLETAVNKLLDFAEFFLSLGDMKQADMLIAIANRNPEFSEFFETVTEPIETAIDFFRVYAGWAVEQILQDSGINWKEIIDVCMRSEKYQILKMQCNETTGLWNILEIIIKHGGKQ
jgi:hypothetical protein